MLKDRNDIVIINLDRPRFLRYGHKALKKMSALTNMEIDAMDKIDSLDVEEIEKIVFCGLLSDAKETGENLKLEDMEDLLDQAPSYEEVISKMTEALNKSFGSLGGEKNSQGVATKK